MIKKKKSKNIIFVEGYIKYHTPSLNWKPIDGGIQSSFLSYYFKNKERARLDVRIRVCSKHIFFHKIYVFINEINVHTFSSWGLSHLSLSILNEQLDLLVAKKKYEKKKNNELLTLFMESEGYVDAGKSKTSNVSKKPTSKISK